MRRKGFLGWVVAGVAFCVLPAALFFYQKSQGGLSTEPEDLFPEFFKNPTDFYVAPQTGELSGSLYLLETNAFAAHYEISRIDLATGRIEDLFKFMFNNSRSVRLHIADDGSYGILTSHTDMHLEEMIVFDFQKLTTRSLPINFPGLIHGSPALGPHFFYIALGDPARILAISKIDGSVEGVISAGAEQDPNARFMWPYLETTDAKDLFYWVTGVNDDNTYKEGKILKCNLESMKVETVAGFPSALQTTNGELITVRYNKIEKEVELVAFASSNESWARNPRDGIFPDSSQKSARRLLRLSNPSLHHGTRVDCLSPNRTFALLRFDRQNQGKGMFALYAVRLNDSAIFPILIKNGPQQLSVSQWVP